MSLSLASVHSKTQNFPAALRAAKLKTLSRVTHPRNLKLKTLSRVTHVVHPPLVEEAALEEGKLNGWANERSARSCFRGSLMQAWCNLLRRAGSAGALVFLPAAAVRKSLVGS